MLSSLFTIEIDNKGEPQIAQVLPTTSPDPNFIKNLKLFVYPDHWAIESNAFFTFVMGDTACEFQLGFVQYTDSFNAKCVISNYYYPALFRSLLSLPSDQIESQASNLMQTRTWTSVSLGESTFTLDGGIEKQHLMKLVFDTFTPFDICKIIIGMIQARHIFVVSSSASVCSRFVAALPLLIEPFRWDMNCIPVLPMKLKEVTQVPVPTLIGLTRGEVLREGRVDARITVNVDMKMVIDQPRLDSQGTVRLRTVELQSNYHQRFVEYLNQFEGCMGFPHHHMHKLIRTFLFEYLSSWIGKVADKAAFIKGLSKLPDYLSSSQVIEDLTNLEHVPQARIDKFDDWFDEMFKRKQTRTMQVRKPIKSASVDASLLDLSASPGKSPVFSQSVSMQQLAKNASDALPRRATATAQMEDLLIDLTDGPSSQSEVKQDDLIDFTFGVPQNSKSAASLSSFDLPHTQPATPMGRGKMMSMDSLTPQNNDLLSLFGQEQPQSPAPPSQTGQSNSVDPLWML